MSPDPDLRRMILVSVLSPLFLLFPIGGLAQAAAPRPGVFVYFQTVRGEPTLLDPYSGRTRRLPCLGWLSPGQERIACIREGDSLEVLSSTTGVRLALFRVPAYEGDYPISAHALHWSPDGKKILLDSPYYGDDGIATVCDLDAGTMAYQRAPVNFVSWLPDSDAFLTDSYSEGFTSAGTVLSSGPYNQSLTFYRHGLDAAPASRWGQVIWPGPAEGAAQVGDIRVFADGSRTRVEVEAAQGWFEGEAPTRGVHPLEELSHSRAFDLRKASKPGEAFEELRLTDKGGGRTAVLLKGLPVINVLWWLDQDTVLLNAFDRIGEGRGETHATFYRLNARQKTLIPLAESDGKWHMVVP